MVFAQFCKAEEEGGIACGWGVCCCVFRGEGVVGVEDIGGLWRVSWLGCVGGL